MTDGLLKDLNWNNLFVAGGIVLGALLCTDDKDTANSPKQWEASDVDLYIHNLGPVAANKKIQHIFNVFKTNLSNNTPVLVVRNSKTITFFSKYPLRRIQIVLKLVHSPKDVLLNFDLDICAIGWDGNDVWMLPRAARALETGYTVFTMDLINGHYLGDRRATQEERVFKYADKGYGLRFLPSYLTELQFIIDNPKKLKALPRDHEYWGPIDTHSTEKDFPWNPQNFHQLVDDARKWTAAKIPEPKEGKPETVLYRILQERYQMSADPPRRSPLSGLSLFMRHVALWEHEVTGAVVIPKNSWASQVYNGCYPGEFGVSYDDTPNYRWDENFTIEGFVKQIVQFNQKECAELDRCIADYLGLHHGANLNLEMKLESKILVPNLRAQRIVYADSVEEILHRNCDIFLPFGIQEYQNLELVIWHINNITMWQQLSRTIDEVHEVLWCFHLVNAAHSLEEADRLKLLVSQFARRAIRLTAQDEYAAFARWALKKPTPISDDHDFDM
ncbi:hypothetical protein K439DRAFT_959110 [Ramaria rubella]|nr:hypothetical protein K439DRAFT_959110 [Ramaria rubella]